MANLHHQAQPNGKLSPCLYGLAARPHGWGVRLQYTCSLLDFIALPDLGHLITHTGLRGTISPQCCSRVSLLFRLGNGSHTAFCPVALQETEQSKGQVSYSAFPHSASMNRVCGRRRRARLSQSSSFFLSLAAPFLLKQGTEEWQEWRSYSCDHTWVITTGSVLAWLPVSAEGTFLLEVSAPKENGADACQLEVLRP